MSIWLVTYAFRDGSLVRRTLDAPTMDEAYDASALPETVGDRVLDSVAIEEQPDGESVRRTTIQFGDEEECTEPTPPKEFADPGNRTGNVAQQDTS